VILSSRKKIFTKWNSSKSWLYDLKTRGSSMWSCQPLPAHFHLIFFINFTHQRLHLRSFLSWFTYSFSHIVKVWWYSIHLISSLEILKLLTSLSTTAGGYEVRYELNLYICESIRATVGKVLGAIFICKIFLWASHFCGLSFHCLEINTVSVKPTIVRKKVILGPIEGLKSIHIYRSIDWYVNV